MKPFLITISILFLSSFSHGQCRGFVKANCEPLLGSYIPTGQLNYSELNPGNKSEFMLTFYQGQDYRIIACADAILPNVHFTVRDENRRLIFDSLGETDLAYDFKVASTQRLIISLIAPDLETPSDEEVEGCVSAMVGFRY
jgi:hypothetical protein